ncbi:cilia- and flagella-associated protein 91-like [Anticarsia gemmatalis]|uniref:cilia- and flagella-associated protein 91-like n=1 Tax=Anticarsia gemmatalis TaxID=129554 RepID=UPI003F7576DD
MSADTIYAPPRKHNVAKMRVHDYLYDSAFIVSGARDYARTAFKAAMSSAQLVLQPLYGSMFSESLRRPRIQVVYHPNCRLPDHIDRSYDAYLDRVKEVQDLPTPDLAGKDLHKFFAIPKQVLAVKSISPDFCPPSPVSVAHGPTKPRNRGTQSLYRESSAQTIPWQPDGKPAEGCETTPEVLYLDQLEWGPGKPYRIGDLPADFHTTEIINKMRHARMWTELVEKGAFPRWMKKRDEIISDIETKDWIFREAEIDELQGIRLELLARMQTQQRQKQVNRTSRKLAKLWAFKKTEMERKIDHIRRTRDREHRKLVALHEGGGRVGLVGRMRAARGMGAMCHAATDPTSDLHAPMLRHGYQARRRHAEIVYDPSLLSAEDHMAVADPPVWLERCQDLTKSCSGHHLPRDPMKLCERETKWSEQFLENLHNDLKKARLGAASTSAGPLHVLKPRRTVTTPRPSTPEVESVEDLEESAHQAALVLQKVIKGRAVQYLMYEGRTRAAELTEELKTTHGLQKEDKIRIAREESKAREYNAMRTEHEQKDDAITALVDELCGGAVSAALDFLEKELRRLKEERRQHAFILIALREKTMREAAEAGRRQKEEHRRREHDEMFKHVLGVTQGTVDAYLKQVITEGVELAAEEDAVKAAKAHADRIDQSIREHGSISTAEQNEMVAELVQQFLLPHVHKTAARHHINEVQNAKLAAARNTIFGLVDDAEIKHDVCEYCGRPIEDVCQCRIVPLETSSRKDWRWKLAKKRPVPPEIPMDVRFPMPHEARRLLNAVVDDVVRTSRQGKAASCAVWRDVNNLINERMEVALDAKEMMDVAVDVATGLRTLPVKQSTYRHAMRRVIPDAIERSEPFQARPCPQELPSEIRRRAEEKAAFEDPTCRCDIDPNDPNQFPLDRMTADDKQQLLPSTLRVLEEMRRCKCDMSSSTEPDPNFPDDDLTDTSAFEDEGEHDEPAQEQ